MGIGYVYVYYCVGIIDLGSFVSVVVEIWISLCVWVVELGIGLVEVWEFFVVDKLEVFYVFFIRGVGVNLEGESEVGVDVGGVRFDK